MRKCRIGISEEQKKVCIRAGVKPSEASRKHTPQYDIIHIFQDVQNMLPSRRAGQLARLVHYLDLENLAHCHDFVSLNFFSIFL